MVTSNKLARELDTREKAERPKQWRPASLLPEPIKEEGYEYRWVRTSINGQSDDRNVLKAMQEGWEAVAMEEQSELQLLASREGRYKDKIEVGGLLLMKTPKEFVEQRNAYVQKNTDSQMRAVDNTLMRQSDARMPIFNERKSTTTFGKGE
jgi:hypothetical protein